jgi:hypothetical protein
LLFLLGSFFVQEKVVEEEERGLLFYYLRENINIKMIRMA